jgi:hypothetical protein
MKHRLTAWLLACALVISAAPAGAQVQTGDISGKVTDNSGSVVPGVMVTISGPSLPKPLTATTSETGSYQFPRLPIGTYEIKYELTGFKTVIRQGVRVELGSSATINQQVEISSVEETVTVTGESPVIDAKATTAKTTFDLETLQSIPSARDPWVMLERVPNITMDRINVGGSQSGQQSGYISRGSSTGNNKWSMDGVDITDMSATGASPIYYDFDMLQEMSVTTGGADASQQTGGVGVNFVTKSGTNAFKGSGRLFNTNERFQADNVTSAIREAGAGSGNPIQNINDFGFELGGPIKRDRLWAWGSYGRQDINVGVVGFYADTPTCRPTNASGVRIPTADIPKVLDTETLRGCLASDNTLLNNYNVKLTAVPFTNNRLNFQNTWAEKVRNARDASDTRPIETAYRQKAVDSSFGTFGWISGPSPIWKLSDQHVFSDRFLVDLQLAHIGNNFTLTFQEPGQRSIQPTFDIPTEIWGRSFNESVFMRPTESVDLNSTYFLPNTLGGDHSFKAGYRMRWARGESISHYGGNAIARFNSGVPAETDVYRDGWTNYGLDTHAIYLQDAYTRNRATLNLGVRWDRQTDEALATTVPASPILPDLMPAIEFPGIDSGVVWNDISPRLGLNYDLFGSGRTILRTSYSMYFGQLAPGQLASNLVAISQVFVRHPWTDTNNDGFVQTGEVNTSTVVTKSAAFDPANPTAFRSPGAVDPNVKNDRTREFIAGFQQEIARNLGFEVNYIWRRYDQFQWSDRVNFSSSDFAERTLNPTNCSTAATCGPITYFVPTKTQPAAFVYTNVPDRYRNYNGVEFAMTKRYSGRWMGNASFAYNDARDYWDSPAAYEDPTNINNTSGHEYAPESGGSGIDNIYTNSKWLVKANGMYSLPWYNINVAANTQFRQGYPFPRAIQVTNRGGGLGTSTVLLEPLGSSRLPNVAMLDLRVDKVFQIGNMRLIPSMDVFNVTNENTVQSQRRVMYSYNHTTGVGSSPANANLISSIISPRIIRFGVKVNW